MKIKLFALSAVATFMFACGGGGNTPEAVTESFHKALADQNYDKAADMATEEGKKNVESLKSVAGMAAMGGEEPAKTEVKITEVKCDTKETTATCTCKEEGGKETKYDLVKKDDKWLVDYKKGLGGEGMEDMETEEEVIEEEVIEEDTTTEAAPVEEVE